MARPCAANRVCPTMPAFKVWTFRVWRWVASMPVFRAWGTLLGVQVLGTS